MGKYMAARRPFLYLESCTDSQNFNQPMISLLDKCRSSDYFYYFRCYRKMKSNSNSGLKMLPELKEKRNLKNVSSFFGESYIDFAINPAFKPNKL